RFHELLMVGVAAIEIVTVEEAGVGRRGLERVIGFVGAADPSIGDEDVGRGRTSRRQLRAGERPAPGGDAVIGRALAGSGYVTAIPGQLAGVEGHGERPLPRVASDTSRVWHGQPAAR